MAGQTALDPTPSMNRVKQAATGAGWGYIGGLSQLLGDRLLGPDVGPLLGGALAGAIVGGDVGRIIAVSAAMDAAWRSAQST